MEGKSAMLYKTLVVGVIVLFVGVGVQPAFAVSQDVDDSEDYCELCPSFEKLIKNRDVEINPDYLDIINSLKEMNDRITRLKELNNNFDFNFQWHYPFICTILLIIQIPVMIMLAPLWYLYDNCVSFQINSLPCSIIKIIFPIMEKIFYPPMILLTEMGKNDFGCKWAYW